MRWTIKTERFSLSYQLTGRKNGYKATIRYDDYYKLFYFLVYKGNKKYSSLWDKKSYTNEEECKKACEEFCEKDMLKGEQE